MVDFSEFPGPNVHIEPVNDGNVCLSFVVPADDRPQGWFSPIRLPQSGVTGSLSDPSYLSLVKAEAEALYRQLDRHRNLSTVVGDAKRTTVETLARLYVGSKQFGNLSEKRKKKARGYVNRLVEWSASRGHPEFTEITTFYMEDFLDSVVGDSTRHQIRCYANCVFKQAPRANLGNHNPVSAIPYGHLQPKLTNIWTAEDVEKYASEARNRGQPGLAAYIETTYCVGQRMGDLCSARHGYQYLNGKFKLKQSKTGQEVEVRIPRRIATAIEAVRVDGSEYLFHDGRSDQPFTTQSLVRAFNELRSRVAKAGEPRLILMDLRHSAVCRMALAGRTPLEIASVTGHQVHWVGALLTRYHIRTDEAANQAIKETDLFYGASLDEFDFDEASNENWKSERLIKSVRADEVISSIEVQRKLVNSLYGGSR